MWHLDLQAAGHHTLDLHMPASWCSQHCRKPKLCRGVCLRLYGVELVDAGTHVYVDLPIPTRYTLRQSQNQVEMQTPSEAAMHGTPHIALVATSMQYAVSNSFSISR